MRIWLDDIREMPGGFDLWVKNPYYMLRMLREHEPITYISFDHDLGCGEGDGYEVAKEIERRAHEGSIERIGWDIHSANPVGRHRIEMAMESADRCWDKREQGRIKMSKKEYQVFSVGYEGEVLSPRIISTALNRIADEGWDIWENLFVGKYSGDNVSEYYIVAVREKEEE